MSARVDGVASRVQSAIQMRQVCWHTNIVRCFHVLCITMCAPPLNQQVTASMGGVVKSMDAALKSMNLEKVCCDEIMLFLIPPLVFR